MEMLFQGKLKEPYKFRNYSKIANSKNGDQWRLVDRNNKNEPLTEFRETKFTKSEISLATLRLEILKINSGV